MSLATELGMLTVYNMSGILKNNSNLWVIELIADFYDGSGKQENTNESKKPCNYLGVVERTKEMNETDLAQYFTSNFLSQFVYQETFQWKHWWYWC